VVATNAAGAGQPSPLSHAATPFAPPKVSRGGIRGTARRAPRLAFTVTAGRHSPKLLSVAVTLPRGLRFDARRLAGHVLVGGHRPRGTVRIRRGALTISLRRAANRMAVNLVAPAVSVTASFARDVERRRVGRQTVTLKIEDAAHNMITGKLRLRPS
jgi:hypothetical protein